MSEQTEQKPHSADYFNEERDFWWNPDFLKLMGQRWQLEKVGTVLDVGCGLGSWGQILCQILPAHTTVIGIDQESQWVEQAQHRVQHLGLAERFRYQLSNAQAIPFPDCEFDLVTCQTVLIHVADPLAVLQEMLRVLKPGGLLAVAEPNNLAGTLLFSNLNAADSVEQICQTVEFELICERGKIQLGEGYNSIGDLLPGYFAQLGLQNIQTYISDKASPLFSPYASTEQQVIKQHYLNWVDRGRWGREESLRYFLAGGGTEQAFKAYWTRMMQDNQLMKQSLLDETFHMAGGSIMYLVSGQKPY